jgi:hypothetical protein
MGTGVEEEELRKILEESWGDDRWPPLRLTLGISREGDLFRRVSIPHVE